MHLASRFQPLILGTLSFIILFCVWELSVMLGLVDPFFVSSPSAIAGVLLEQFISGELFLNLKVSLFEFIVGYAAGILIGVPLGLLVGWYRILDYALDPFIWFIYSAPIIGFYPVFILIFGLGKPTVIVITFKLAVILILVNTAAGIKHVDPSLLRVAKSFSASRMDLFFKVALPASMPMVMAGLRLGVGRALMGVVSAEMFGATAGLGASISYYGSLMKTDNMLASLMMITTIGVILTQILRAIESYFDSWRVEPKM